MSIDIGGEIDNFFCSCNSIVRQNETKKKHKITNFMFFCGGFGRVERI